MVVTFRTLKLPFTGFLLTLGVDSVAARQCMSLLILLYHLITLNAEFSDVRRLVSDIIALQNLFFKECFMLDF